MFKFFKKQGVRTKHVHSTKEQLAEWNAYRECLREYLAARRLAEVKLKEYNQ
jgi:hypothetical protein